MSMQQSYWSDHTPLYQTLIFDNVRSIEQLKTITSICNQQVGVSDNQCMVCNQVIIVIFIFILSKENILSLICNIYTCTMAAP